jgi:hypothetical protein
MISLWVLLENLPITHSYFDQSWKWNKSLSLQRKVVVQFGCPKICSARQQHKWLYQHVNYLQGLWFYTISHTTTRKGDSDKTSKNGNMWCSLRFASDQYSGVGFITYPLVTKRLAPVPPTLQLAPSLHERIISPACNKFPSGSTVPALDPLATLVSGYHDIWRKDILSLPSWPISINSILSLTCPLLDKLTRFFRF